MLSLLDSENHVWYIEAHAREMRKHAEEVRLVREAKEAARSSRPRTVRRHVAGLLIAMGEALVR